MQPISEFSNGNIMSALSSLPSGILTPTIEALSNMRKLNPAERLRYERKKRFASHGYSGSKIVRKNYTGRPVLPLSVLVRPWTRKKTDYRLWSVRSYLQEGRTERFGTLVRLKTRHLPRFVSAICPGFCQGPRVLISQHLYIFYAVALFGDAGQP